MTEMVTQESAPTCLNIKLRYPVRGNFVVATALFRGLFDAFSYVGGAIRQEVSGQQPVQLVHYGNVKVFQTDGLRLNQSNADIFMAIVQRALNHGFKPTDRILIKLQADELLAAVGRDDRHSNRAWLARELSHMKDSAFMVSAPNLADWKFTLLSNVVSDQQQRGLKAPSGYEIELNDRLADVFEKCGWHIVKEAVLVKLLSEDLFTRALYLFYCTYPSLPWLQESELQKIFHRENTDRKDWLTMLRKSLATIRELTGWYQLEMITKTARRGNKLLRRGLVIAIEHSPEQKASKSEAKPPEQARAESQARHAQTVMAKNTTDLEWSMYSTPEDLRSLGKQAFVATGKYGSDDILWRMTSMEQTDFEEQYADLGRLSEKQKMEHLYDFLLESRADLNWDDNDI